MWLYGIKIKKKQTELENHEIYHDAMTSFVDVVLKLQKISNI
jgi:hypothetical protein